MSRRGFRARALLLAASLGACLLACTSPGWQRIVGPDGSPMAHVHCGSDQGTCFRIAGEVCPSGYDIKAVLSGNDGNFLVRCRGPRPDVAELPPAPALPRPATPPPGLLYPWPPPGAGTAARSSPPQTGQPAEIDLGY